MSDRKPHDRARTDGAMDAMRRIMQTMDGLPLDPFQRLAALGSALAVSVAAMDVPDWDALLIDTTTLLATSARARRQGRTPAAPPPEAPAEAPAMEASAPPAELVVFEIDTPLLESANALLGELRRHHSSPDEGQTVLCVALGAMLSNLPPRHLDFERVKAIATIDTARKEWPAIVAEMKARHAPGTRH